MFYIGALVFVCLLIRGGVVAIALLNKNRLLTLTQKAVCKIAIIVSILATIGLTIVMCIFTALGSFADGLCGDNVSMQAVSSGGSYIAYGFVHDCGAVTSSGEMQPLILLRDKFHPIEYKDDEIVFRKNWLGQDIDRVVFQGAVTGLKWLSDNHLQIEYRTRDRGLGMTSLNGVKISYKRVNVQ
jgi:hypothetical protein